MVWTSTSNVRLLSGLTTTDIGEDDLNCLIQVAQKEVLLGINNKVIREPVKYIDSTRENTIDGCFHGSTGITTDNGNILIKDIVNKKLPVKVWSYNFEKQKVELVPVTNGFRHERKEDVFINISTSNLSTKYNKKRNFKCTPNHLIYTDSGYKPAEDIKESDILYSFGYDLNPIQEQLIYGSLLGDASMHKGTSRPAFTVGHSTKQSGLVSLKGKILANLLKNRRQVKSINHFGVLPMDIINSSFESCFEEALDICYSNNGKKKVTREWLNKIGDIGLAFWYMDDGSKLVNPKSKEPKKWKTKKGWTPNVSFATNGFSEEEVDLILTWLLEDKGIKGWKINSKKGYTIRLSADGSRFFYKRIAPYVCEDLKYKLPDYCDGIDNLWDMFNFQDAKLSLKKANIEKIEIIKRGNGYRTKPAVVYDLETPNNNYFVGGVLVHNSNTTYYIKNWEGNFIGDYNYDLSVDTSDLTLVSVDSDGTEADVAISSVTYDEGKFVVTTAQNNVDMYLTYTFTYFNPVTPDPLLKLATEYLAGAYAYMRIDSSQKKQVKFGNVSITNGVGKDSAYSFFHNKYMDIIRQLNENTGNGAIWGISKVLI